jgi:hypothetical protein
MARPKRIKAPARLDLVIERASKRDAFALATRYGISISKLFELLIVAEKDRKGQLALQNWKELTGQ